MRKEVDVRGRTIYVFENIEPGRLFWKNFRGEATARNAAGERNFALSLLPDEAEVLLAAGFDVKPAVMKDNGEVQYMANIRGIKVSYDHYPPDIRTVNTNGVVTLINNEMLCGSIDDVRMLNVARMDIRPRYWKTPSGETRIKPYLALMYVEIPAPICGGRFEPTPVSGELEELPF